MKNQTIAEILKSDSIRGILASIDEESEEVESLVFIARHTGGGINVRYFASPPEVLGLCELCRLAVIREIEESEESYNDD